MTQIIDFLRHKDGFILWDLFISWNEIYVVFIEKQHGDTVVKVHTREGRELVK